MQSDAAARRQDPGVFESQIPLLGCTVLQVAARLMRKRWVAAKLVLSHSAARKMLNGMEIAANAFHDVEETTDVYGLFLALFCAQSIELFSRHLLYEYGPMINYISFD